MTTIRAIEKELNITRTAQVIALFGVEVFTMLMIGLYFPWPMNGLTMGLFFSMWTYLMFTLVGAWEKEELERRRAKP